MSFTKTLEALAAEEVATALTDERYEEARQEWEEIQARRAALRPAPSDGDGDTLARIVGGIRRHGPKAAKYLGYPGLATAITAGTMAEDGTFIGPSGFLTLLGQLAGW